MTSQFFLYRYKFQPLAGNSRYTPSFEFLPKYPECQGIATLTDELVPESKYKTLPNGQISGLRIGKLEWDSVGMSALNFTDEAVVKELIEFGRDFAVKTVTKEELAGFLRAYTNVTERETGLFVTQGASTMAGLETPEKTLDLR